MNTPRILLLGAVISAALASSSVNAQVLGGNVGGAVGGTLSGGLRDMGVATRGSATGTLDADIGADSLRRTTRDTLDRTTTRARNTASAARNRAESTVGEVRDTSMNVATTAAATATQNVDTRQVGGGTNVGGSAVSNASANGTGLTGTASQAAAIDQPSLGQIPTADQNALQLPERVSEPGKASANGTHPVSSAVNGEAAGGSAITSALGVSSSANGSASGDAVVSKQGVSASAQGSGSASVAASR